MTKADVDFEAWFSNLQVHVLERTGLDYRDEAAVRADYDAGRDLFDVVEEIAAEYRD